MGDGCAENESAGFDASYHIDAMIAELSCHVIDNVVEENGVAENGRDVFKDDARPGKIGDVAHGCAHPFGYLTSCAHWIPPDTRRSDRR
jgi:hypothetical protein